MSITNVAVLASGRGSNFQAMTEHQRLGIFDNVNVALLIYNHQEARVRKIAEEYGTSSQFVNFYKRSRVEAEHEVLDTLKRYDIDLICLAGWDQIIGSEFFRTYRWRLMNIHPSLHPAFAGKGLNAREVHREVLRSGVCITGCTVFYVDKSVDSGPIILQKPIGVKEKKLFITDPEKAIDILSDRVLIEEHRLYPKAVQLHADRRLESKENYFYIIDENGDWRKMWERKQKVFVDYQEKNLRNLYGSFFEC